jgi:uncharacterized membrane protein
MDHGASSPTRAVPDMTHFLHVLSVIVWFGGAITLNVLAVRVGMGADRAAQAALLRLSDLHGRAVIAPAGIVTLVTGFVLIVGRDIPVTTLWVSWGLIGLIASVALGGTLIRATQADLRRLTETRSNEDEPRRLARQRRAAVLYGLNLVILLSIVWATVFKPTL